MAEKLPIGVQDFEGLRTDGYLYVDKTAYLHRLVQEGKAYFLSRPRRFGKSLLISTLRAYWEGRKERFEGLQIAELERDDLEAWKRHPVFLFDFNGVNYQEEGALETALDIQLSRWEEAWHLNGQRKTLSARFQELLIEANRHSGRRCVVLVDEYDKPLLETLDEPDLEAHNKAVFKGFFSTLKQSDEYLRFVFITGVTKFEKVSIFSDLNHLRDISLSKAYAGICGITETELVRYFTERIGNLDGMRDILTALFARTPYTQEKNPFEHYFQAVIYLIFQLLGQYTVCEMHTWNGRVDCILETGAYVYLFEFKRDDSAQSALKQIRDMEYGKVYAADFRKRYRIGVSFDSGSRMLTEWIAEEDN